MQSLDTYGYDGKDNKDSMLILVALLWTFEAPRALAHLTDAILSVKVSEMTKLCPKVSTMPLMTRYQH